MKAAKLRNNKKQEKEKIIEEEYSLKNMLFIIVIIVVILLIFYFITVLCAKPAKDDYKEIEVPAVIDSTKITIDNLLNRKEKSYFVLATKTQKSVYENINYSEIYEKYITNYKNFSTTDILEFYYVDLNEALNKNYISDKTRISNNLEQLKISDDVLFKIENKKIVESYVGYEEIIKALTSLVPNIKRN